VHPAIAPHGVFRQREGRGRGDLLFLRAACGEDERGNDSQKPYSVHHGSLLEKTSMAAASGRAVQKSSAHASVAGASVAWSAMPPIPATALAVPPRLKIR